MVKLNKQSKNDTPKDEPIPDEPVAETPEPVLADEANDTSDITADVTPSTSPTPQPAGKRSFIKRVFRSKKFRIAAPLVVLIIAAVVMFVAPVKFAVLNLVTSGQAKFVVVDDATLAPVTDATISVGKQTGKTDKNGALVVQKLDFGAQNYQIKKETYTTKTGTFTLKPGDNLVGPVKFHSEGTPVEVHVTNKLSNETVKDFTVSIDATDISARSNKEGVAILKLPSNRLGKQTLTLTATGFNKATQAVTVTANGKLAPLSITMTPEGKHYFLSNRDGKVGVYVANLDGSEQAVIVPGLHANDSQATLSISPDAKYGAMVSTRDNQRGPSGTILPALYSINFETKTIKRVDEGAPEFAIRGWNDNTIVYTVNYNQYERADNYKIKTAEATTGRLNTLAALPGYPTPFYFPESPGYFYVTLPDPTKPDYGFFSYNVATKAKQRVHNEALYTFGQTKPFAVQLQSDHSTRYELNLKTQKVQPNGGATTDSTVTYVPSANKQKMAWIEQRDGKGVVVVGDQDGNNGKQVTRNITATYINGWHGDDYLFFTSVTAGTNADYVVHIGTGVITKISDIFLANNRFR